MAICSGESFIKLDRFLVEFYNFSNFVQQYGTSLKSPLLFERFNLTAKSVSRIHLCEKEAVQYILSMTDSTQERRIERERRGGQECSHAN